MANDEQIGGFLGMMESYKKTVDVVFRYTTVAIMLASMVLFIGFIGLVMVEFPVLIVESPVQMAYMGFLLIWCFGVMLWVSFVGIILLAIEMVIRGLQDDRTPDDILVFVIHRTLALIFVSILGIVVIPLFVGIPYLDNIVPGFSVLLTGFVFIAIGTAIGGAIVTLYLALRKSTLGNPTVHTPAVEISSNLD